MESLLKVGLDHAAPVPLHTDIQSERFEGFEVDLLQRIAKSLNRQLEYKVILWKDILGKLESGEVDLVCSAVTVTEKRKEVLGFCDSYLDFHLGVVTRKEQSIKIAEELRKKKAGVRIATEAEEYIIHYLDPESVYTSDSNDDLYQKLTDKSIDYLVDDTPIAGAFTDTYSALEVSLLLPGTESSYAIALSKENHSLQAEINRVLSHLKQDGSYDKIYQRWFQDKFI